MGAEKPNAPGFYGLGWSVVERILDGFDAKDPKANCVLRGGLWGDSAAFIRLAQLVENLLGAQIRCAGLPLSRARP